MTEKTIKLQIGSGDNVDRYDPKIDSKGWETIIEGHSTSYVLEALIEGLNNDDIIMDNNFMRIITDSNEVKSY